MPLLPHQVPKNQDLQPFDPSFKGLIIFAFPKSSSKYFDSALEIAKYAKYYCENIMLGQKYFFCGFDYSPLQVQSAMALHNYTSGWKGVHLFINNILREQYWVQNTLECYLKSLMTREPKYYCCSISNKFIYNDSRNWIHPCRLVLLQQTYYKLTINNEIPLKDQIFAQAIRDKCEWCPSLNLDNLKPINHENSIKDIS